MIPGQASGKTPVDHILTFYSNLLEPVSPYKEHKPPNFTPYTLTLKSDPKALSSSPAEERTLFRTLGQPPRREQVPK